MTVNEEKRGNKVRCKECDELIPVPKSSSKKKREDDEAIQDSRKVAAKAVAAKRSREDDDEDDRPARPQRKAPAKSNFGLIAILGGGLVALLFVGVLCVGAPVGFILLRSGHADEEHIVQNARNPIDKPIGRPDPNPNPNPNDPPIIVDPNPKIDPPPAIDPGKQLPDAINPQQVPRVKASTVYLRVTMPSGQVAEGSGFFAMEPRIVVTNAHVLGMLQASSKPPRQVEVTLNSGEPNQTKLIGEVLGVDRASDLAVVRVPQHPSLPAPLQLENDRKLLETQPVYIFGFPLGAQLGANITVSASTVSSLRKNQITGALEQIQVNGGMHPGNSGGPVVNSMGNVVGVAVAGIRGTQINFAVPAENVRMIMEGRLDDHKMGEAFLVGGETRLPVKYTCLDPLNRVNAMRIEVWTGVPGAARPHSFVKPQPVAGDSERISHVATYLDGKGEVDVPLPKLPGGHVHWLQPVIITAKGTQWGTAISTTDGVLPLERKPANLVVSLTNAKERNVNVKSSNSSTLIVGKTKEVIATRVNAEVVEFLSPDPLGALMKTAIGKATVNLDLNGRPIPIDGTLGQRLPQLPPVFVVDGTNKLRQRADTALNPNLPATLRNQIQTSYNQLCNAMECTTLPMPNRTLQPGDSWNTQIPMLQRVSPGIKQKLEVVDLEIKCTYRGTIALRLADLAVITVEGHVKGRGEAVNFVDGDVTGKFMFNLTGGFISVATLKISSEEDGGGVTSIDSFDIFLSRASGNPLGLAPPMPKKNPDPGPKDPGPQAGGKFILQQAGSLLASDPVINEPGHANPQSRMKQFPVNMQAGREYVITLNSKDFDSYVILYSPKGVKLAHDDDGGGFPNSRLMYKAAQTGQHRITVTSFDGQLGAFQLAVQDVSPGEPKIDPNPKIDPMPKVDPKPPVINPKGPFKKPAAAKAATTYLKIDSTPGDFIGQGKSYNLGADKLTVKKTNRGVEVQAAGWHLEVGAPNGQFLQVGEYLNAKRYAFSGASPGLDFFGQGRGSNTLAGAFVVWELEMNGDQIVRLAIDFVQRSEEKGQPLNGKLRINSTLQ